MYRGEGGVTEVGDPTNAKTIENGCPTVAVAGEEGFVDSWVAPASV